MSNDVDNKIITAVDGNIDQFPMLTHAIDKGLDAKSIEKLVYLQERIIDKNAEQAFNQSMMTAQSEMPNIIKDKENTQTRSKYSAYETVLKVAKPIYTKHGFSVMFYEEDAPREDEVRICADIMHEQGNTKKRHADVPLDEAGIKGNVNKTKTHAKGSSISYGRSYLLKMIFNIGTSDDDDGNAAGGNPRITEQQALEIDAYIKDNDIDMTAFMTWLKRSHKCYSIETITAESFNQVRAALKKRVKNASS